MYVTISRGRKPASLFLDEALRCALTIGTQLTRLEADLNKSRRLAKENSSDRPDR